LIRPKKRVLHCSGTCR